MTFQKIPITKLIPTTLAGIVIGMTLTFCCLPWLTCHMTEFKVTGLERVPTAKSSKWLVLTTNETFENTDTLYYLKFRSSDLQGRLAVGHVYNAKVYGWRVPFFSWYRNIVSVEESK